MSTARRERERVTVRRPGIFESRAVGYKGPSDFGLTTGRRGPISARTPAGFPGPVLAPATRRIARP